jgi:hypothetical protein
MAASKSALYIAFLMFVSGPNVGATATTECQSKQSPDRNIKSSILLQKQLVNPALMQSSVSMAESVESLHACGPSQTIPMDQAGLFLNSRLAEPESTNLGFIFIPQNDGKMIEALGREHGLNWGVNAISPSELLKLQLSEHEVCTWNLVPPRFLQGVKVYANKPLFCVTRDPSERLFSTYLSVIKMLDAECPIAPADYELFTRYEKCTPESLNYFTIEALTNRTEWAFDCNLIPQYKYVWDWDGEQACDEIIKFKDLKAGLPALLAKYNIPLSPSAPSLLQSVSIAEGNTPCPGLTLAAFDAASMIAIRKYYNQDYVSLGFN